MCETRCELMIADTCMQMEVGTQHFGIRVTVSLDRAYLIYADNGCTRGQGKGRL